VTAREKKMDIYEVLKEDHEKTRRLLDALEETEDDEGAKRARRFAEFKIDLLAHHQVEESVLYYMLKRIEETRDDALEAISEHHVVDMLLEELDDMPKEGDEWRAKFGVLKELVEHHMREEEEEFFAAAKKVLDADQAEEMGAAFQEKKTASVEAQSPVNLA
jgi:hemerythrin superfamily protein